ncbi:hypothetical protein VUR80DRAFT_9712 [Thermomyces stellatus]
METARNDARGHHEPVYLLSLGKWRRRPGYLGGCHLARDHDEDPKRERAQEVAKALRLLPSYRRDKHRGPHRDYARAPSNEHPGSYRRIHGHRKQDFQQEKQASRQVVQGGQT